MNSIRFLGKIVVDMWADDTIMMIQYDNKHYRREMMLIQI